MFLNRPIEFVKINRKYTITYLNSQNDLIIKKIFKHNKSEAFVYLLTRFAQPAADAVT